MPKSRVSDQLAGVLKDIYVPDHVVTAIVDSITADQGRAEAQRDAQMASLHQRLAALRTRMDQAYEDKLDGKVDEQMWTRKMNDWGEQEIELEATLQRLEIARAYSTTNFRTRESCAFSVPYAESRRTRPAAEIGAFEPRHGRRKSHGPTYRTPFDLIFERAKNEEWSGRRDSGSLGVCQGSRFHFVEPLVRVAIRGFTNTSE